MRKRLQQWFGSTRLKRAPRRRPALQSQALEPRYAMTVDAVGDAFDVNDFFAGEQSIDSSSVAVAASNTNRVVVWQGRGSTDRDGVYARVFDQDGQALDESFRVNTTIRGEQHSPTVATAADGSFVVAWAGRGFGDLSGVFFQRFSSQGVALGEETLVNTTIGGVQTAPALDVADDGSILVGWEGVGAGDDSGVFFRRFDDEGVPLGAEVGANTTTLNTQRGASVALLANGDFAVGWQTLRPDGLGWDVVAQRFDSAASPLGGETTLSTTTENNQTDLTLAANPLGGFVASWQSFGQDGDGQSVVGRAFNSAGDAITEERLLSETTAGDQLGASIAVAPDGQWIATYTSVSEEGGVTALTRTFDINGVASDESVIDPTAATGVPVASLAVVGDSALVIWSGSSESDRQGVRAQQYRVNLVDNGDPVSPVIAAISDFQGEVNTRLEFSVTASDGNAFDRLTFALDPDNSPADAEIEQTSNTTAVIRFTPTEADENTTVDFNVLVTDNSPGALADSEAFSVVVSDVPLVVDLDGPESSADTASVDFIVGDAAVLSIAPQLSLSGAAGGQLSGAVATLVAAPNGGAETLSVLPAAGSGITASYDPATRRLTLTGDATVAEYEATLRTLIYNNTADFPEGQREVSISAIDADGESAVSTATVQIVQPDLVAFARALGEANIQLFGAAFDATTTQQRELFQDGAQFLPFTEVTGPNREPLPVAFANNITQFPTWVFADGSRIEGLQTLAALSAISGVPIPTSVAPTVAPIEDTTLLVGSPLHVALDGYDPNGGPLTFTVESDNPDVSVEVLTGNRSLRLSTNNTVDGAGGDFGDLVFELFEGRAQRATDRVIELAESGFYDGLTFHRIINDFVIQGGDPNGDGTGGSDLGNFDDQFNVDLQHNRTGLLSFAKSTDDTNNSQFFITEGDNTNTLRNLDFNHTVFGLLTEGEDIRAAISDVATGANDLPVNPVRIDSAEVFTDTENGVLFLRAADGATGSANITVTVTDQDGNSSQETFQVNLADDFTNIVAPGLGDTSNGRPFLQDIAPVTGVQGQPTTFQLEATDVEGDDVTFFAQFATNVNPQLFSVQVDEDGLVTVQAPASFIGELPVQVSVHRGTPTLDGDFQVVSVTIDPPEQTVGTLFPG